MPRRADVRHVAHLVQVSDSAGQLPVLALALLPLIAEAIALGLCLGLLLKLHVFMAIAGAVILAGVCPALLGAAMHEWQGCRLGTRKGASLYKKEPLCCLCAVSVERGGIAPGSRLASNCQEISGDHLTVFQKALLLQLRSEDL